MGNLTVAIRAAQSGLLTNQAAIDATAKNIANTNTPGYSRKIVNFENRVLAGNGAGVQLSNFTRTVDQELLKDLRRELSATSELSAQVSYFTRTQNLFGAPGDNTSISHTINRLHQAAESLALSPEKTLEKNEFIRFAQEVALQLQSMSREIQGLRTQADAEIAEAVKQINDLTQDIADTNNKIIRNNALTRDITDLLDNRDEALRKLSELVEIATFPRNEGDLVVFTTDGTPLVDRSPNVITHEASGFLAATSIFAAGNINGIFVGGSGDDNDITDRIKSGEVAALIKQRDEVLPNLQSQLDELAASLRDTLNQLHNRGTTYPGLQSFSGERQFIDAENQTIRLEPAGGENDVAITIFDSTGTQVQTTTLETIMTSGAYGTGIQASRGPWSITEVAASVEDWLQGSGANGASVGIDALTGKLNIEINDSSLYLAFRDQATADPGSDAEDAEIGFDSDGDGDVDETISGFSNFFRLNDLYTDGSTGNLYDSVQLPSAFSATAATITFYDSANGVGAGNEIGSVSIEDRSSLEEIAEAINDAAIGVSATVIPDGSGSRLRVLSEDGLEMVITQGPTDTLLTSMGFGQSNARSATTLQVRDEIQAAPGLTTTAMVKYDTKRGRYVINQSNNEAIEAMAEALSAKNAFNNVGGLTNINRTFEEFSTDILSRQANLADTNKSRLDAQTSLTQALELESDSISGVNLDEEMSNLIVYQQSFSASARVISVIQQLFDTLNDAVR